MRLLARDAIKPQLRQVLIVLLKVRVDHKIPAVFFQVYPLLLGHQKPESFLKEAPLLDQFYNVNLLGQSSSRLFHTEPFAVLGAADAAGGEYINNVVEQIGKFGRLEEIRAVKVSLVFRAVVSIHFLQLVESRRHIVF